jgi:hypothetical protein
MARYALGRAWDAFAAGISAALATFREEMVTADPLDDAAWELWENRVQRYRFLWAVYENSAYSDRHLWSHEMRRVWDLYAHVRSVLSPAHGLGEFYAQRLMGGALDRAAGDGSVVPSALPIVPATPAGTVDPALRTAIGRVWRDSNWQVAKSVWTRYGAVFGDTLLQVVDDQARRKVYLVPVRPTSLKYVDVDPFGNCKGYVLEEERPDPEWDGTGTQDSVTYTEVCEKRGEAVTFRTFNGGDPYDWRSYPDGVSRRVTEWTRPYGFVPLVLTQHIPVGGCFGWSEFHALLSRIRELDDLGSCLTDQARRKLNNPVAINAAQPREGVHNRPRTSASEVDARSQSDVPTRGTQGVRWIDKSDLKIIPLVGDLAMAEVTGHARMILDLIYAEYPELLVDSPLMAADQSGRARRILRQAAEAKVVARRAAYDDPLVRAHQMAVTMGALGGYPDYDFPPGAFEDGALDHAIGPRPVFAVDPLDDAELLLTEGNAAVAWANAEVPPEVFLKWLGKPAADIAEVVRLREEERREAERRALRQLRTQSRLAGRDTGGNPPRPREMTILPPTGPERVDSNGSTNGN